MLNETYDYITLYNKTLFVFESEGVAKTIYEFLGEFPERTIVIKPVDERRRKLYNRIFQRHFEEMKPFFDILGFHNEESEVYSPKKYYNYFKISLKFDE